MIRSLRRWMSGVLGVQRYLQWVSRSYLMLTRMGALKSNYPELFYLERIVKPGDVCIDIGANLGYYTIPLSRLCGPGGQVWSVEPVPMFAEILKKNLSFFGGHNVSIVPFALGAEETTIQMGTPEVEGVFRHGCTRIIDSSDDQFARVYSVEVRVPDVLFGRLERLDFVKCDIEGYEAVVFQHFVRVLERFKPTIQVEISGPDNKRTLFELLGGLGYRGYYLAEPGKLVEIGLEKALLLNGHDFYFKNEHKLV